MCKLWSSSGTYWGSHKGSDKAWAYDEKQKGAANKLLNMMHKDYLDLTSGNSYYDKQKAMADTNMQISQRQSDDSFDLTKEQTSDKFNLMKSQSQDSFEQAQLEGAQQAESSRMGMSQDTMGAMVQAGKSGFAGGQQNKMQKDMASQMGMSMKQIGLGLAGQEKDLQNAIQSSRLDSIQTVDASSLQTEQAKSNAGMSFVQTSADLDNQLATAMDDMAFEMQGIVSSTIQGLTNPYQSYGAPSDVQTIIDENVGT